MAKFKKSPKAYEDSEFLYSSDGRSVRILTEFLQPRSKFRKHKIMDTIVFFGSARLVSKREALKEYNKIKSLNPKSTDNFTGKLREAQRLVNMSRYYEDAVELSRRLTEWSMNLETMANRFIICTGGGPGIMEAANKGAKKAGGYSIGLNISIPYEQFINKYVTPDLSFEFHYFFMRKFWFAYLSKAFIIFPGGFGTMDELFEVITLIQTAKMKKKLAMVIYDKNYWNKIINFDALVEQGMISKSDVKLFSMCSNIDDAYDIIVKHLSRHYAKQKEPDVIEPVLHIK
ncbi:MAG: TIGR00730 family Rossman fold protein [Ignavibacteria bacterium]|nr:TIGR00730 family Rossman fold protein [Ignavibacteria bacterium]MBT8381441.1 TIGR00730 family Rossman fold protein [Ignavibacteria bacterium]MBT8392705.1 TIGR00730 family Rossman fold protein [Ignavibacteria bacterium]NNJ52515.1 TIGR00730 family Rossman fold protein [Ignavibacteriaceae bacterium]NNL21960.1 TIGR00730 family Rossman fold protein [Ignavibacteriaceae bacterium]